VAAVTSAHILYMEDDAGLARLLQKSLQRLGHSVDIADNGEAGLAMVAKGRYDLVLVDYNMPVCGGMDVLRFMTAKRGLPPVIMVTGNGNERVAVEALKLGATDYIVKDVDMGYLELLPIIIGQVLEKEQLIREREQMFLAVQESEERYRKLVELSPDGIAIHQEGRFVFVNPTGMEILGVRESEELLGREILEFVHPNFHQAVRERVELLAKSGKELPLTEEKFLRLDGTEVDVEVVTLPFTFNGEPACQAIFRDITERKLAKERLEYMANFDALTALPNRTLFFDRLGQVLFRAKRYQEWFALLFLDLDRFKQVNDTFGHDMGDRLLEEVADRLIACLRESDTVARMGGDEFAVILSRIADMQDAESVACKIIKTLAAPFCLQGHECTIGASIGISIFPCDSLDPESLLKMADTAMYQAKENGRNTFSFYSDGLQPVAC